MPHPDQEVIRMFEQHEEIIAELYKLYAERHPEHHQFWMAIHKEEKHHAELARRLLAAVQEGRIRIPHDRFNLDAVRLSVDYVRNQLAFATRTPMPAITCLSMAKDIEQSALEKKFFQAFEGDPPALRETLQALAAGFNDHALRLDEKLQEVKRERMRDRYPDSTPP